MKENQPWGETIYTVLNGSHISFQTKKASIDLITNPFYGRMLFIDGTLQSTTSDEQLYHSSIISAGITQSTKTVLIAGGAEGSLAKHILSLESVSKVVMVDWDEELVNHMRTECFAPDIFNDSRLTVVHEDIVLYISSSDPFDTIILDLLDPSESDIDWLTNLVTLCLKKTSCLSLNAGGDYTIAKKILDILTLSGYITMLSKIHVPSFQEAWYILSVRAI
jgi:spermidine synthase